MGIVHVLELHETNLAETPMICLRNTFLILFSEPISPYSLQTGTPISTTSPIYSKRTTLFPSLAK